MKAISIKTGVFDDRVWVVAPCSYREALGWLKAKRIADIDGIEDYELAQGICRRRKTRSSTIVFLKKAPVTPAAIAVLAHEAVHCATFLENACGIADETDELSAYVSDFIVRKTLEKFRS
jgi:hypothetical protein